MMQRNQFHNLLFLVANVARARPSLAPLLIAKNLGKLQRVAVSLYRPDRLDQAKASELLQHATKLGAELKVWITVKNNVTFLNLDGIEFAIF